MKSKIRVLIAKVGLDGHDRGAKIIAKALRDAGMEVIYLGNQLPDSIVQSAIQEDVDVVGLSTLSGNHMLLAPEVVKQLRSETGLLASCPPGCVKALHRLASPGEDVLAIKAALLV